MSLPGSPRSEPTVRVATYNLLHGIDLRSGQVDLFAAAALVARLRADVVAVQEADRGLARSGGIDQVAELGRRCGLHATFAPALLGDPDDGWTPVPEPDPGGPAYGVGLLTAVPPRSVQRIALPGGGAGRREPLPPGLDRPPAPGYDREPRTALVAELSFPAGALRVVTTHLSYLPWRGLAQLRALVAALADLPPLPTVLTGDLNLPALGVRAVVRGGWRHAQGFPTYPAWRPRVQPDQLLVRGALAVRDVTVGPRGASDHLPLTATLELGVVSP